MLQHRLDITDDRALHVTLLPDPLAKAVGKPPSTDRLITWETVQGHLQPDTGNYWGSQREHALQSFANLQA